MNYSSLINDYISKNISSDLIANPEFINFSKFINATLVSPSNAIENTTIKGNDKLIMNAALNSIVIFDSKGIISFLNTKAETVFGWEKEEIIGRSIYETIVPERYVSKCTKKINKYIKTGKEEIITRPIELALKNKTIGEFIVEISIVPLVQDEKLHFCAFIEGISETKKEALFSKKEERKYRNIISNINIGLIEIDNDGLIQFSNEYFSLISGYEINDLIGKNPIELFVSKEDATIVESKKALRNKGISDIYQIKIKNKKGEIRWWTISGSPKYDENGTVMGSVGLHLDITEQKLLEIELEKEKINAEVSAKAKELFLINMSHEIRTPLNAIIGFLRELKREELSQDQRMFIKNSSLASYHLMAIINNILDLSKIEAKEMHLEYKNFNFKNKIINVISVLQNKAKEENLTLTTFISDKIHSVLKGDILRIEQILYNIAGNSLKFTKKGIVSIRCEMIKDYPKSQDIRISISDTGIGMDPKFIAEIFNKFSQEDHSITRKFGGTGLGMSISNELIRLMNGTIEIESKKNIGTIVHINFNLKKGKIIDFVSTNFDYPKIDLKNISILLVDDNAINRLVAQKSLGNYNCTIIEAYEGKHAIEILKTQKFDVILMDIIMPEMDGVEATKIIRNEMKITIPIIAFTANAFKSEIDKFIEIGMDDYVIKPYDETILIETIAKHTIHKSDFVKI